MSCNTRRSTTDLFFYETDSLKSGDIILRKSYGLLSDVIIANLNDTLQVSHCGIIIKNPDNSFSVIHSLDKSVSVADGVQECTLKFFMQDSRYETVKIVRFKKDSMSMIARWAQKYLKQKIKFDTKFDLKDSSAFYCSELPYHIILNEFNVKLASDENPLKFSAFLNSEYFNLIPFVK